jgi:anti-sigma factor RsiW
MSLCADLICFADGELEADRAASFRDHLATCEACQAGLVEALQLNAQLSALREHSNGRDTKQPVAALTR